MEVLVRAQGVRRIASEELIWGRRGKIRFLPSSLFLFILSFLFISGLEGLEL
jgi:hypothetical protein